MDWFSAFGLKTAHILLKNLSEFGEYEEIEGIGEQPVTWGDGESAERGDT